MPTRSALAGLAFLAALGASADAALAFEPVAGESPRQTFQRGFESYQAGDLDEATQAIQYAADHGDTRAMWMLAQMYAQGVGVARDDKRAFDIFASLADAHVGDNPNGDDAPFIADALVALGDYYREGVPDDHAPGTTDVEQARLLYWHAATYFADPEAQYNLAEMFETGELGTPDPLQAVRWARMAAETGDPPAQALLGYLLFQGNGVTREPVVGLAYLQIARTRTNGEDPEIRRMHEEAFSLATETERRTAAVLADQWLSTNANGPVATPPEGQQLP